MSADDQLNTRKRRHDDSVAEVADLGERPDARLESLLGTASTTNTRDSHYSRDRELDHLDAAVLPWVSILI